MRLAISRRMGLLHRTSDLPYTQCHGHGRVGHPLSPHVNLLEKAVVGVLKGCLNARGHHFPPRTTHSNSNPAQIDPPTPPCPPPLLVCVFRFTQVYTFDTASLQKKHKFFTQLPKQAQILRLVICSNLDIGFAGLYYLHSCPPS